MKDTIKIKVKCNLCAGELKIMDFFSQDEGLSIYVDHCPICYNKQYDDGYDVGQDHVIILSKNTCSGHLNE